MGIDRIAVGFAKHPTTTVVRGWKGNGSPTATESHNGSTFTEFTMTKISQGSVSSLILAHLANAPNRTAQGSAVRVAVLALVGGDPTLTHDINCIGNARHDLMKKGLVGDGSVRGEWVLTDAGLAVHEGAPMPKGPGRSAPKAPKAPKTEPAATDAPVTDPAPAVETPAATAELAKAEDSAAPAVETPAATETPAAVVETPATPAPAAPAPKRRLKVADAPAAPVTVPEWLSDPEIRGAVIENQDCFGAFSAKSPACGECALAGFCRNAKAAQLDLLARKLLVANPLVNTPVAAPVAKLDAAVSAVLDPNAPRAAANPTGGTIKATYDGVCGVTGREIKKGMAVRYVQGKGMVLAD